MFTAVESTLQAGLFFHAQPGDAQFLMLLDLFTRRGVYVSRLSCAARIVFDDYVVALLTASVYV